MAGRHFPVANPVQVDEMISLCEPVHVVRGPSRICHMTFIRMAPTLLRTMTDPVQVYISAGCVSLKD